jgi:hypothetical protein
VQAAKARGKVPERVQGVFVVAFESIVVQEHILGDLVIRHRNRYEKKNGKIYKRERDIDGQQKKPKNDFLELKKWIMIKETKKRWSTLKGLVAFVQEGSGARSPS